MNACEGVIGKLSGTDDMIRGNATASRCRHRFTHGMHEYDPGLTMTPGSTEEPTRAVVALAGYARMRERSRRHAQSYAEGLFG
jgi:hypothetical protein